MREADSLESYLRQPVGTYVSGPTYAVWWRSMRLNGVLLWGRPNEQDIHRMARAIDAQGVDVQPHVSLVEALRLESVDPAAFSAISKYVFTRRVEYSRLMTRQALLRPPGLVGATVAGFYEVTSPLYAFCVFADPAPAFDWLGLPQELPVLAELDAIYTASLGVARFVTELRACLESRITATTLHDAAAAMGLSPRSLQRKLRDAQTTFQSEVNQTQVRVAKSLLLDTDHGLKRIAMDVGCRSLQHFSALFRRHTGTAPGHWRCHHLAYRRSGNGRG